MILVEKKTKSIIPFVHNWVGLYLTRTSKNIQIGLDWIESHIDSDV